MNQQKSDTLFVTIVVRDRSGKKVAGVKNAKYKSGMAQVERIVTTKYQSESGGIPPLIATMIEAGAHDMHRTQ